MCTICSLNETPNPIYRFLQQGCYDKKRICSGSAASTNTAARSKGAARRFGVCRPDENFQIFVQNPQIRKMQKTALSGQKSSKMIFHRTGRSVLFLLSFFQKIAYIVFIKYV